MTELEEFLEAQKVRAVSDTRTQFPDSYKLSVEQNLGPKQKRAKVSTPTAGEARQTRSKTKAGTPMKSKTSQEIDLFDHAQSVSRKRDRKSEEKSRSQMNSSAKESSTRSMHHPDVKRSNSQDSVVPEGMSFLD